MTTQKLVLLSALASYLAHNKCIMIETLDKEANSSGRKRVIISQQQRKKANGHVLKLPWSLKRFKTHI